MIKYIQKNCTGCRVCEIICSMEHIKKINTGQTRIKYYDKWPRVGRVEFCRQCPKRACIQACPQEALYLSPEGYVQMYRERCIACLECSEACPYGSLPTDGRYPLFCDTCSGLYQCVGWCPQKALKKVGEKNG